jgi:disulfide bond formation protein DsbB
MTVIVTTFLALLAILAAVGVLGAFILVVIGRGPWLRELVGPVALWLAFVVALTATSGSLYLSQVVGLEPCTLCWYQRIAMYPQVVILGIAAWRGDVAVWRYAGPLAAIGAVIATYHVVLQRLPELPSAGCSLTAPCNAIDLERFGFVTIPLMALIAFLAILTLLFAAMPSSQTTEPMNP